MEENKGMVVYSDDGADMIASLTDNNRCTMFTSIHAETREQKAKLLNIMNGDCDRLAEYCNMPLYITDVFCEIVDMVDKNTGEVVKAPRIILIDKDGKGYACVSKGVFGSLKRLMDKEMFYLPPWNPPVKIVPKRVQKAANKSILMLHTPEDQ